MSYLLTYCMGAEQVKTSKKRRFLVYEVKVITLPSLHCSERPRVRICTHDAIYCRKMAERVTRSRKGAPCKSDKRLVLTLLSGPQERMMEGGRRKRSPQTLTAHRRRGRRTQAYEIRALPIHTRVCVHTELNYTCLERQRPVEQVFH